MFIDERAEVVELVDALRSGRSGCKPVGVRVPPSAHKKTARHFDAPFLFCGRSDGLENRKSDLLRTGIGQSDPFPDRGFVVEEIGETHSLQDIVDLLL